jgi:hypothetical protein
MELELLTSWLLLANPELLSFQTLSGFSMEAPPLFHNA